MGTKEEYLMEAKSRRNKQPVDLQYLAVEYQKLLDKEYGFWFENDILVTFQFGMENFYHLLGFHKLTDVTVISMVERKQMKKEDFYKYVLSGKITYDTTDSNILGSEQEGIVNIDGTKEKSALGEIRANRFTYFSEDMMLDLLSNDPVIDYDGDKSKSVIEADKIFFQFQKEKMRNLNLFLGYNDIKNKFYATTFFLESSPNSFRLTEDGKPQKVLHMLSRWIKDMTNNRVNDFKIRWPNVRKQLSQLPCYRAQKRLKVWMNSNHIKAKQVTKEIFLQENLILEMKNKFNKYSLDYKICMLIRGFQLAESEEDKDQFTLKLMEYDVDIEDQEQVQYYDWINENEIQKEINRLDNKLYSSNEKLKTHKNLLPELVTLEYEEVRKAYAPYLHKGFKWKEEFIEWLINEKEIFENTISPSELEALGVAYDKKHEC